MKWQIENATLYKDNSGHGLVFSNGLIDRVLSEQGNDAKILSINLHGLPVYPGMINAHDSLIATYFPIDKPDTTFRNWLAFDNKLKSSEIFKERMRIEISDLYSLGGYKNIINGATTVVDHIPHFVRKPFIDANICRLLPDFGISHSVCSYNLNWGSGFRKEHDYAVENDLPYIIHIAEGVDTESSESLSHLDDMGALSEHTVLVHGISLDEADLELIAKKGAHLVWCPVSNMRLYEKTLNIELALELGINICLGTDHSMTGSTGLLNELNFALKYYNQKYNKELDPVALANMVFENPVRAFRISGYGKLEARNNADCIVLDNRESKEPAQGLILSDLSDVFLVIRNGQPVYGDESLEVLFKELGLEFAKITIMGSKKIVHKGYLETLENIREKTNSDREFPFLPVS